MNKYINIYNTIRKSRQNIKKGRINLVFGCMFSSKTETLIARYKRYTLANKKCIVFKYEDDIRYSKSDIVTHEGINIPAIPISHLYIADQILYEHSQLNKEYDVILIDEIQFFQDADIICDILANEGYIIECFGLSGTYERKPFPIISKLIPLCEDIQFNKAICKETGNDAVYSYLHNNEMSNKTVNNILIGGASMYSAYDRETFFKNDNNFYEDKLNSIKKLIN